MLPVREIPAGTLVFLECGCAGFRGIGPVDGPALITIEKLCATHAHIGQPQLRYLEQWELVSPLARPQSS